jgi:hypothetical protein
VCAYMCLCVCVCVCVCVFHKENKKIINNFGYKLGPVIHR